MIGATPASNSLVPENFLLRELLLKIGGYGFVVGVIVTVIVRFVFDYDMIVWPTIILTYPALILLGAAVGLGDFVELFRVMRMGDSAGSKAASVLFVLFRGAVFVGILGLFLRWEILIIMDVLRNH